MIINRTNSALAAVCILVFSIFFSPISVKGQTGSNILSSNSIVDLTHTLDENFPYIPIPGITFSFKKTPIAAIDKMGVAANRWEIHEHIGTQIDAPSHFFANGLSLDQMPVRNFIAPLVVIDISERAQVDNDTAVTVDDIKNWEELHGPLPKGAAVFMYSGWESRVRDAKKFINMDSANTMRFPGWSVDAVSFLAHERDVVGIGVDTLSLDPGKDKQYNAHKAWLAAGKWGVECVASLKKVPPVGATVFVGASKVGGATGGLVRLIATVPLSVSNVTGLLEKGLAGKWKSATAERVGNLGFRTREFAFSKERWKIEVIFFEDEQMTKPVFSFVGEGPYRIGKKSETVPGATDSVFHFDRKLLTLLTSNETASKPFVLAACELSKGVTKDISSSGCGNFTSVATCGQEYDLLKLEGDELQLGGRPSDGNMCTESRRPKALGSKLARVK